MTITKRIVCLANSRKLSGRCVAGRELIRGRPRAWIRPVSDRPNEAVSMCERQYADSGDPRVLDIIDISLHEPRPKGHQQENWLLDSDLYWAKVAQYPWSSMDQLVDKSDTLWCNGYSTRNGKNDRIPINLVATETGSLKLIYANSLQIKVFCYYNKRRVQAQFRYADEDYEIWVTDPIIEQEYLMREDGNYRLRNIYLTISLGEPNEDNFCYKLVAAVIRAQDARHG